MKKKSFVFLAALLVLGSAAEIHAEDNTTKAGYCEFNGKKMLSTFDSNKVAASVSEMEPGDSVTFEVEIANKSEYVTDWYMSNLVLSSLEDAQSVAENGGYTYILTYSQDDTTTELYSSESIGGEKDTSAGVGLNEATNSLKNFFELTTLDPEEKGIVRLYVGLDGESQGNIYQDTLAKLMMNFAVQINSEDNPPTPDTPRIPPNRVKTGDVWIMGSFICLGLGIVLVVVAFVQRRKGKMHEED